MTFTTGHVRKLTTAAALALIAVLPAALLAQPVALVTEPASGARLMRQGVPNALSVFHRLLVGDEIVVEGKGRLSILYISNRRRETLSAPARVRIGSDSSEVLSGRLEVEMLGASAPGSLEWARAGSFRYAFIDPAARAIAPPRSPAAGEEIARAIARHNAWRRDAAASDTLPELYVLSVLDTFGQLEAMNPYLDRIDAVAERESPLAVLAQQLRLQTAARTTVTLGALPFRGDAGDELARELSGLLESAPPSGQRRRRVAKMTGDALQLSSQTTRSAVIRDAARKVSAEYAIYGMMVAPDVVDSTVLRTATECIKVRREGVEGKPSAEQCIEWKPLEISCTRRTAIWRLELTLMEIHSGRTLASDSVSGRAIGDGCANLAPPGQDELLREARADMLAKARELVESRTAAAPARFAKPDAGVAAPEAQAEFSSALSKAVEGNIGGACADFGRMATSDRNSASVAFNAATCEEEAGRYNKALTLYRSAEAAGGLNQVEVGESIERLIALAPNATSIAESTPQPSKSNALTPPEQVAAAPSKERRVALVIGNSAYPTAPLRNPVNDARDVARVLSELDFEVIRAENATLESMNRAIDQFALRAQQYRGVALIFFAGHGMQVEGENYLIPIDADFRSEREVTYRAINLGLVLAKVEQASSRVNILILDACRDNPFARTLRSARRGLASVDAPKGTVIAYATAPGKTAADGDGRNGLYSKHLLREMRVSGARIEDVLKRTGASVSQESSDQQIPWVSSSLTGDFYFRRQP